MLSQRILTFIIPYIFFQVSLSAQYFGGVSFGVKNCFSYYLDPNYGFWDPAQNRTWGVVNDKTSLWIGYKFKKLPMSLQTGIIFSKFSNVLSFKTNPEDFGGIGSFIKSTRTFTTFEMPIQVSSRVFSFSDALSLWVTFGASVGRINNDIYSSGKDESLIVFSQKEQLNYYFDYLIMRDYHRDWGLLLNGGLEAAYSFNPNFDVGVSFSGGFGLTQGATYVMYYAITGPFEKTHGDAISHSKWDTLSLDLNCRYYFVKHTGKKKKR